MAPAGCYPPLQERTAARRAITGISHWRSTAHTNTGVRQQGVDSGMKPRRAYQKQFHQHPFAARLGVKICSISISRRTRLPFRPLKAAAQRFSFPLGAATFLLSSTKEKWGYHPRPRSGQKMPPDFRPGAGEWQLFSLHSLGLGDSLLLGHGGTLVGSKSIPLRFRLSAKTTLHSFAPPLSHHSRCASAAGTLRIAPDGKKVPG